MITAPSNRVISLDLETYPAYESSSAIPSPSTLLPASTYFHPLKDRHHFRVPLTSQIQSASITLTEGDPLQPWTLRPTTSFYFNLNVPSDQFTLLQWLRWSRTILGWNIGFDLLQLRHHPYLRQAISGQHHLIDGIVLNYLLDETTPERSLKDIGTILGTHSYSNIPTLRDGQRFPHPSHPDSILYSTCDSHFTVLAIAHLSHLINQEHPCPTISSSTSASSSLPSPSSESSSEPSPTSLSTSETSTPTSHKLSPSSLSYFSSLIWSCIHLSESGLPFSLPALHKLEDRLTRHSTTCERICSSHGLLLTGKGSESSKFSFLSRCLELSPTSLPLELTEVKRQIATSETNRNLLISALPFRSLERKLLRIWSRNTHAQKLLSSYTFPLLRHSRANADTRKSALIPSPRTHAIGIAYASWFPVPSSVKDGSGDEGGQVQARPSAKNPSIQTFPTPIKHCVTSRYALGSLLSFDLSQIELRVAALLSQEPILISEYLKPKPDLHTLRAVEIFGPSITSHPHFKSKYRQCGKHINFADIYRASAPRMQATVAELVGLTLPLAFFETIQRRRPHERPILFAWQESLIASVAANSILYVPHTPYSRYFEGDVSAYVNEIVNCPIQTIAAMVNNSLKAYCTQHLYANPLLPIHVCANIYDALVFDAAPSAVETTHTLYQDAFNHVTSPSGFWGQLCSHYPTPVPLSFEHQTLP